MFNGSVCRYDGSRSIQSMPEIKLAELKPSQLLSFIFVVFPVNVKIRLGDSSIFAYRDALLTLKHAVICRVMHDQVGHRVRQYLKRSKLLNLIVQPKAQAVHFSEANGVYHHSQQAFEL